MLKKKNSSLLYKAKEIEENRGKERSRDKA